MQHIVYMVIHIGYIN